MVRVSLLRGLLPVARVFSVQPALRLGLCRLTGVVVPASTMRKPDAESRH